MTKLQKPMTAKEMLHQYEEFQAQITLLRLDFEQKRTEIIPPEVRQELADLELEYGSKLEAAEENLKELADRIKAAVVEQGESVSGTGVIAVYMDGRVTWDSKRLEGYIVSHPELLAFRKVGQPSVTIRQKGK